MDLLSLINRFSYYAQKHKTLIHNPAVKADTAFIKYDWDDLNAAVENAVKFPCLFLETPAIEKDGNQDNVHETYEITFMVLDKYDDGDFDAKTVLLQKCKTITDDIYCRMQADAPEFFESEMSKTQEGSIAKIGLTGWVVTLSFTISINASVNAAKWGDL